MGVPASHGCIRMRNADVIELFDLVPAGTEVLIREGGRS
jgi:lipoprotein-anchoring transpeptidase ErfK/SrfK